MAGIKGATSLLAEGTRLCQVWRGYYSGMWLRGHRLAPGPATSRTPAGQAAPLGTCAHLSSVDSRAGQGRVGQGRAGQVKVEKHRGEAKVENHKGLLPRPEH